MKKLKIIKQKMKEDFDTKFKKNNPRKSKRDKNDNFIENKKKDIDNIKKMKKQNN